MIDGTYTTLHNSPDPRGLWTAEEDFRLQSKFVDKVKGHEFNLAIFVAEGQEAIETTVNVVKSLITICRNVKNGNYVGAFRALNDYNQRNISTTVKGLGRGVGGRVLQYRYGIAPLIEDVYNAWKAYETLTSERKDRVISTRSIKKDWYHNNLRLDPPSVPCELRKKILYEMKEHLSLPRSLGLTNPAAVLWEKLPWSFVADWFIPIGTYLNNLDIIPALRGRFLTSFSSEVIYQGVGNGSVWWAVGGTGRVHIFTYQRGTSLILPVKSPQWKSLSKALSWGHMLNAFALFAQVAGGSGSGSGSKPGLPH